jgi:hypothetical protein
MERTLSSGEIIQVAYIVEDLHEAMERFTARLGIGPWFVLEHAVPPDALYRSQPTSVDIHAAFGFSGQMQYELIQQLNDVPSVYLAHHAKYGYGFHHLGRATTTFDADVEQAKREGREAEFLIRTPATRLAYIDNTPDLPGWIELMELTPAFERRYLDMLAASRDWDGSDPIRSRQR